MLDLKETVENLAGRKVTRVKSSLFYFSGALLFVFGIVLIAEFKSNVGATIILIICPFLFLYPLVRALMLGKDSIGAVLITAFLDYYLNKKIRSNRDEKR